MTIYHSEHGPASRAHMTEPKTLVPFPRSDEPVSRSDFARLEARVELILKQLPTRARKGLSEKTKRQHRRTIEQFFNRKCPCCGRREVLGTGEGEFDHFTDNRNRNGPHDTWLICIECHDGFSRGSMRRDEYRTLFDAYQWRRRQENSEFPRGLWER